MGNARQNIRKFFSDLFHARLVSWHWIRKNVWLIVLCVVLAVIPMILKYEIQTKQQRIKNLRQELVNSRTDMVKVTTEYASRIRESEMMQLVDTTGLRLKVPDQPPYSLDGEQ